MSNTTGYATLSRDRKMHERAIAIQRWLATPITRLIVSKRKRGELAALLAHLTERLTHVSPVEHLTFVPPVGWSVRLLKDSWILRDYHDATTGSIGTVVAHSRLTEDDNGVLVDWGTGRQVRCNLNELALEQSPLPETRTR